MLPRTAICSGGGGGGDGYRGNDRPRRPKHIIVAIHALVTQVNKIFFFAENFCCRLSATISSSFPFHPLFSFRSRPSTLSSTLSPFFLLAEWRGCLCCTSSVRRKCSVVKKRVEKGRNGDVSPPSFFPGAFRPATAKGECGGRESETRKREVRKGGVNGIHHLDCCCFLWSCLLLRRSCSFPALESAARPPLSFSIPD